MANGSTTEDRAKKSFGARETVPQKSSYLKLFHATGLCSVKNCRIAGGFRGLFL